MGKYSNSRQQYDDHHVLFLSQNPCFVSKAISGGILVKTRVNTCNEMRTENFSQQTC